jgi:hypothetical protein
METITLTPVQFLVLLGFSGAQLATLAGIFLRLGRIGGRLDDHARRLTTLEGILA